MSDQQTIPVLDLTEFHAGGDAAERFARDLGTALGEVGFFAVINHGVEPAVIRSAYAAAEEFFLLPEPAKRRYEDLRIKGQRGFTSFGREHARDHPVPDLKEYWHVGREFPPGHPLEAVYLRNVWPEEVPDFREVLSRLFEQLDACALALLAAASLYLELPESTLPDLARDGNTILRLIHYPPVPHDVAPASMRAAPHEDINLITLLCEATDGGLELLTRGGEWLPIRALPGQIIVDAGDMLQNVTNGILRSTTHRVVNAGGAGGRRLSMPFFVHPRSEVSLAPLPRCVERQGGRRLFPEITAGAYLEQRLREIGLV